MKAGELFLVINNIYTVLLAVCPVFNSFHPSHQPAILFRSRPPPWFHSAALDPVSMKQKHIGLDGFLYNTSKYEKAENNKSTFFPSYFCHHMLQFSLCPPSPDLSLPGIQHHSKQTSRRYHRTCTCSEIPEDEAKSSGFTLHVGYLWVILVWTKKENGTLSPGLLHIHDVI